MAASAQWPTEGVPDNPRAWLVTVAGRRLVDQARSDIARRRREETVAAMAPGDELVARAADDDLRAADHDDTLTLLLLCCHPSLSPPTQAALTLRAVGGLTTAEIARAYFVPEATMAQRISRAKQTHQACREPLRDAVRTRTDRAVARRAAGALPDLQRGLYGQLRPGARPGRPDPRSDPPDPGRTRATARRRRSRRSARADDPDRGAAVGANGPGR